MYTLRRSRACDWFSTVRYAASWLCSFGSLSFTALAAPRSKLRMSPESISSTSTSRCDFVGLLHHARADDDARRIARAQLQFDARALHLIEERRERRPRPQLEREIRQALLQGIARIVAHAVHLAAIAVGNRQRLQDVVHVVRLEIQARRLARLQFAGALQVRHAVLIQRYFGDGKIRGRERRKRDTKPARCAKTFSVSSCFMGLDRDKRQASDSKSYCPFQSIGRENLPLHRNLTPGMRNKFLGRMLSGALLLVAASAADGSGHRSGQLSRAGISSPGVGDIGTRSGEQVDLRYYAGRFRESWIATSQPFVTDAQGNLIRIHNLYGIEVNGGVYGVHQLEAFATGTELRRLLSQVRQLRRL